MNMKDDVKPLHVRPDPVVLEAQRRFLEREREREHEHERERECGRERRSLAINFVMRFFDDVNRPRVNVIVRAPGEGSRHFELKEKIAKSMMRQGFHIVSEALFKKEYTHGRYFKCDIVVLEQLLIVEIRDSESDASVQEKWRKKPVGWNMIIEEVR